MANVRRRQLRCRTPRLSSDVTVAVDHYASLFWSAGALAPAFVMRHPRKLRVESAFSPPPCAFGAQTSTGHVRATRYVPDLREPLEALD
jgi:hypothetical protein